MTESTRITGWKAIADALGVSESTARRYEERGAFGDGKDLLPVFGDHRQEPWIDPDALEQWKRRSTMSWGAMRCRRSA